MTIQLDSEKRIINYALVGGFPDGIETGEAPEDFTENFWPGKWAYEAGMFRLTGIPNPADAEEEKYLLGQRVKEEMASASAIAFVALAQNRQLDDAAILEHPTLFPMWDEHWTGNAGSILIDPDDGNFYRSVHNIGAGQNVRPGISPAMWTRIGNPAEEWPEWRQPIGAHDAYAAGAKAAHGGRNWISGIDGNIWEPGVYGWTEQQR